jgi:hypothetical protein
MDVYRIALFVHLLALIVAAGASAVMKLAAERRARSRTVAEMLEWHQTMGATARLFPVCLAVFVLSGAFMLSRATPGAWASAFVSAGLLGVVLLLASSVYLGISAKGLGRMLSALAERDASAAPPKLAPPPLLASLPAINTGIALAVAFDMVTKPTSLVTALAIVAGGILLGAAGAMKRTPRAAPATMLATPPAG